MNSRPTAFKLRNLALLASLLFLACSGPSTGGGGGGATPRFTGTALDFGTEAQFELAPQTPQSVVISVAAAARLTERPLSASAMLDKSVVRLTKTVDAGSPNAQQTPDRVTVEFFFAAAGVDDPCNNGTALATFTLLRMDDGDFTIDPPDTVIPCALFDSLAQPMLNVCIRVTANFGGTLSIRRLGVRMDSGVNLNVGLGALDVGAGQVVTGSGGLEFDPVCRTPARATLSLAPAGISVANAPAGDHSVQLTVRVAATDADACASGESIGPFTVTIRDGSATAVQPDSIELSTTAIGIIAVGDFNFCLEAAQADFDGTLSIDRAVIGLE